MTRLSILRYPDPRLSQVCDPIDRFDVSLRQFAGDLLETMRAAPGVGITAAHVGVLQRLFVLELTSGSHRVFVNPQILSLGQETIRHVEGSVSMPGYTEEVERASEVHVQYQDLDGRPHEEEAEGFLAVCIQHEIDQLNGIFWLKRLSRLKRDRLVRKWQKESSR